MTNFDEMGGEGAALFAELHRLSFDDGPHWTQRDFEELCGAAGTTAFVISEGQTPLGFVLIRHLGDEAEILTLCLTPGQRRRGYGSQLLDHIKDQLSARGARRLFLEVRADNRAAAGLYEKASFVGIGLRKDYYRLAGGAKKDACLMSCDLSSGI